MSEKQVYIVAVSGGVDSVVLLHQLAARHSDRIEYIVAHFDHGIRPDSGDDARFVKDLAKKLGMRFELGEGKLGQGASEATAREARYKFLREMAKKYGATKIITAHHQDDLLETMVLNILRGTGPRGLSPMTTQPDILRPFLHKTKAELMSYAASRQLQWHEDSTNENEEYLRNYVRKQLMPQLEPARNTLLELNKQAVELYHEIDMRLHTMLPKMNVLTRSRFVVLPWAVQKELVRSWLVRSNVRDINRVMVERLALAGKVLPAGKRVDVDGNLWLVAERENLLITGK